MPGGTGLAHGRGPRLEIPCDPARYGACPGPAILPYRFLSSALLPLLLVLASPGSAEACQLEQCSSGGEYLPASGTVPASLPAILFYPRQQSTPKPGEGAVALFHIEAGAPVPVQITTEIRDHLIVITPVLPLVPDSDYALDGNEICASGVTKGTFHTGAAAPLPTTLGTLTASTPEIRALGVASGSCSTPITAVTVGVDLALSAEAAPWQGALSVRTIVDGKRWRYFPTLSDASSPLGGESHETLYVACEKPSYLYSDMDLEEGTHTVWQEATIAGSTTVLKTDPISVTLRCTPPDEGTDGTDGAAGGGCSAGGGPKDGAWAIPALAALAALIRRRRR